MNKNMCCGIFRGGDIEPGTFHTRNITNISDNRSEMPVSDEGCREDLGFTLELNPLISTVDAAF